MSTLARRMPLDHGDSPRPRWAVLGLIAAVHVGGLWSLMQIDAVREAVAEVAPIMVSLISTPPRPVVEPPPKPRIEPKQKPQIIAAPTLAPAEFEAPPMEPEPQPQPAEVAPPAPIVPPNFVAAYLDNPAPVYPSVSKKLGEAGRILLRVRVSADGLAERVEVESGSGYPRLDRAALGAVRRWKFVPARQGETAIAAMVRVPIIFELSK
jgi:protein TonB